MTTYYISPTGNDTTGNGSSATPWLTLAKANAASANGDTIILKAGTYTWTAANYAMGFARTYEGVDATTVILDAGGAQITMAMGAANVNTTVKNIVFQNAVQTNTGTNNVPAIFDINTGTTGLLTIQNCTFNNTLYIQDYDYYNGGLLGGSNGAASKGSITITGCLFNDVRGPTTLNSGPNHRGGLLNIDNTTAEIKTITLANNTFIFASSGTNLIDHIIGVGYSGASTTTLILTNNIFYNSTGSSIPFIANVLTGITRNTSYNCYNGAYTNKPTSPGTGDITSDPLFVDAPTGNFALRPTSPCLDTGTLT